MYCHVGQEKGKNPPWSVVLLVTKKARSIFPGSLEEDDNSISLWTQQLDLFHSKAIVTAQSSNRFPSLRQGTKYEMSNRNNTKKIMTIKQNISNNHIEITPHSPVVFILVCNTVQRTQVFNNTDCV